MDDSVSAADARRIAVLSAGKTGTGSAFETIISCFIRKTSLNLELKKVKIIVNNR